ncbi:hypothetical protein ACFX14_003033 [Malus domestica]
MISLGFLLVDRATHVDAGSKNLLHRAGQLHGHGSVPHNLGDLNDVINRDVSDVLDVLGLLAITLGLFQGLDAQCGRRRHHRNLSLPVLDGELDSYASMLHATLQVDSPCPKGSRFRFFRVDLARIERNGEGSFSELSEKESVES